VTSIGVAIRTALGVGGLLALIDLAQVTALAPGSLSGRNVAVLVALYGVPALAGALVLRPVLRSATAGVLFWVGAFLLAQEAVLRALPPLSGWRTPAVVATCVGTLVVGLVATRSFGGRRTPAWAVGLGIIALAISGVGAMRGFGPGGEMADRPTAASLEKPNVLVILIDALRADHLGAYGYTRPTSPRIDAFAKEGALFLHNYSQSSWTKPATASLHTSRFPSMHQTYLEKQAVPQSERLLAEVLREAGWETAILSGNPWITPEWGFAQGVDHFFSIYDERFARVTLFMMSLKRVSKLMGNRAFLYNGVKMLVQGQLSTTARDERLNLEARRWLEEPKDRPFFLYMHYMSPHHPYDPPPPYDKWVPDRSLEPVTYYPKKSYFFFEEGERIPDAQRDDMIARYDGDILFADTVFGKLVDHLREKGLLEKTIVVIVADHGEEFYDHRNWGHGQSIYNELVHVPLIVRFPKIVPAAMRVEQAVMSVDVMPTILEVLGVRPPANLAGRSLVPIFRGEPTKVPWEAYSELLYRYGAAHGLVQDSSKVITMNKGDDRRTELYDLATDPTEQSNVIATSPVAPLIVRRMDELEAWASGHQAQAVENIQVNDEMNKQLNALGYLN